jgi:hypothetical protein
MKAKIVNLIISAGWHEGELSVADDIQALFSDEISNLKRKLREAEDMIKTLSKNVPVKPLPEPVVIPSALEFLQIFSLTTQREMYFNNMLTRTWATEAMEHYVSSYFQYNVPLKKEE